VIKLDVGSGSIKGKVREKDEDSIYFQVYSGQNGDKFDESGIFVLADGMGGGEKGEIASKIAVDAFKARGNEILRSDVDGAIKIIKDAVEEGNNNIIQYKTLNHYSEMGTTITAVFYRDGWAVIANVGDSRTYVINPGYPLQKTRDHSYVQELVESGMITEDEATFHPRRNEISLALGFQKSITPDIYIWRIFSGDHILLCCDGLWEPLHRVLENIIQMRAPCQEKVNQMLNLANDLDGTDNISAILFAPVLNLDIEKFSKKPTVSTGAKPH
jgi:serine/threonine protein phosphatase PrpC